MIAKEISADNPIWIHVAPFIIPIISLFVVIMLFSMRAVIVKYIKIPMLANISDNRVM